MCFMVGKSSAELSLKLLLRLKMQPLYKDVKICAKTMSKLFMYGNYSIIFNDLLYWYSRCRRVAVLNRKVSIIIMIDRRQFILIRCKHSQRARKVVFARSGKEPKS